MNLNTMVQWGATPIASIVTATTVGQNFGQLFSVSDRWPRWFLVIWPLTALNFNLSLRAHLWKYVEEWVVTPLLP